MRPFRRQSGAYPILLAFNVLAHVHVALLSQRTAGLRGSRSGRIHAV